MKPIILPVPHIPQRSMSDCLVACAEMALAHIGISISYQKLCKILRVTDIGTPSFNIRDLKVLGIHITYKQGTLAKLHHHLTNNQPAIIFLKTSQLPYWGEATDHAVVLVGMDNQFAYLNDPVFTNAPISVPIGDFDLAWLERDEFFSILTLS